MAEQKTTIAKKKPTFLRRDWHKKIKLGKGVKKNQKWRKAKGRHNKIRLGHKGYGARPKIGYGANASTKETVNGKAFVRIETLQDMATVKPGAHIQIARVGLKQRRLIIAAAREKKVTVINNYKERTKHESQK